jgi:hypothetical protein
MPKKPTQTRAQGGLRSAAAAFGTPRPLGAAGSHCTPHQLWPRQSTRGGTIPQPSHCRSQLRSPWLRSCVFAFEFSAKEKICLHGSGLRKVSTGAVLVGESQQQHSQHIPATCYLKTTKNSQLSQPYCKPR